MDISMFTTLLDFIALSVWGVFFTLFTLPKIVRLKEIKIKNWQMYLCCLLWPISLLYVVLWCVFSAIQLIAEGSGWIWRRGIIFLLGKIVQHLRNDFPT